MPSPGAALTPGEQQRLAEQEAIVEGGRGTFIAVGNALRTIRDERLYRRRVGKRAITFAEYCHERWGIGKAYANRQIEAAQVATNLAPMGAKLNERQARELGGLPSTAEQQRAFQEAAIRARSAPDKDGEPPKVTAAGYASVVRDMDKVCSALPELYPSVVEGRMTLAVALDKMQGNGLGAIPESRCQRATKGAVVVSPEIKAAHEATLPAGTYSLLYVDPEWPVLERRAEATTEWATRALPRLILGHQREGAGVADLGAPKAALFLWAPPDRMLDALEIMREWGFCYQTHVVWYKMPAKETLSGGCVQAIHELLLIGWRGRHVEAAQRPLSVAAVPRVPTVKGRPTPKPDYFFELMERMIPKAKRLVVMGAAANREGWER